MPFHWCFPQSWTRPCLRCAWNPKGGWGIWRWWGQRRPWTSHKSSYFGLMIADGYLDSCARPAAAIKIEKFDMIRKAWWLTEEWGDHCLSEICFKIFIWKCLKFYNTRANVIFQFISCNLPKLCCALLEPGENGDVEFPSPLHICPSWHLLEDGIPQWFHTKVSQVARGIRGDESSPPNEGSLICTSRQMESFFH